MILRPLGFLLLLTCGIAWAESSEDLMRRGMAESRAGNTEQALVLLRSAVAAQPNFPPVLIALGAVALEARRFEEARAVLEQALQRAPSSEPALYNLAMVYEKLRDWDKARQAWRQLLSLSKTSEVRDMAQRHLDRLQ